MTWGPHNLWPERPEAELELARRRRWLCEEQWRRPGVGNHSHISGWVDNAWFESKTKTVVTLLGREHRSCPYSYVDQGDYHLYKMRGRRVMPTRRQPRRRAKK